MSRENVELVRRFYALALEGRWEQLELLADDVVYRPIAEVTETGEYRGRGGFRRYMQHFLESDWAEGLTFDVTCRDYGDKVVARIQFAGRGRASGVEFTPRVFSVHTIRDGRIARIEDFTDRRDALAAAGAVD